MEAGSGSLGADSSESARGERSAPGLRMLSRPRFRPSCGRAGVFRFRPSRGRAGVSLGLDGCEVCLCDPCARVRPCVPFVSRACPVCVPAPPGVFLPVPVLVGRA